MSTLRMVSEPSRLNDRISEEMRAMMARRRMNQTELAKILGLTQSAVSKRFRGVVAFNADEIEKVADALGVHPATLLGGVGDNSQPPPPPTARYVGESDTPRYNEVMGRVVTSQCTGLGWVSALPDAA